MTTKTVLRLGATTLLLSVITASAATLSLSNDNTPRRGFKRCPVPACAEACVETDPADVQCRWETGSISLTSFACCCCGGAGNEFKPIRGQL